MTVSYNLIPIFTFLMGLCVGSFLNVCIFRIPDSKSIVHPPSACPGCGAQIRFYDNIPVFSYIFLGGKCRNCKMPISIRYPLVELLTGLLALAVYAKFGLTLEALVYFVFVAVLLTISFIDIDHKIIPDLISLPGIPTFFLASLAVPSVTVIDSAIGIAAGSGILYAVAFAWSHLKKIEAMGMGDVKLLAMIGALIGWQGVLFTIFVSSATGTIVGLPFMLIKKGNLKMEIPYGPFISIGAVAYIFFGQYVIDWYFSICSY